MLQTVCCSPSFPAEGGKVAARARFRCGCPSTSSWLGAAEATSAFDWSRTPDDPGEGKLEIEQEVAQRVNDRFAWLDRVSTLVGQVEQWGKELGWATRRIDKSLDDSRIGKHQVPALLMQQDLCRVLLEPIGRSTPGTEGVIDLYLMPAYDDIASLYYYDDRWNLHDLFPGSNPVSTVREAEGVPLSKETLQTVLAEMMQNAA